MLKEFFGGWEEELQVLCAVQVYWSTHVNPLFLTDLASALMSFSGSENEGKPSQPYIIGKTERSAGWALIEERGERNNKLQQTGSQLWSLLVVPVSTVHNITPCSFTQLMLRLFVIQFNFPILHHQIHLL